MSYLGYTSRAITKKAPTPLGDNGSVGSKGNGSSRDSDKGSSNEKRLHYW